jgi:hypothetical protein
VPQFRITWVEFDEHNEHAFDRGLDADDYRYMLMGVTHARSGQKPDRYEAHATAPDGSHWRVIFAYSNGTARPITAIPA